jgi:hypothetical protein
MIKRILCVVFVLSMSALLGLTPFEALNSLADLAQQLTGRAHTAVRFSDTMKQKAFTRGIRELERIFHPDKAVLYGLTEQQADVLLRMIQQTIAPIGSDFLEVGAHREELQDKFERAWESTRAEQAKFGIDLGHPDGLLREARVRRAGIQAEEREREARVQKEKTGAAKLSPGMQQLEDLRKKAEADRVDAAERVRQSALIDLRARAHRMIEEKFAPWYTEGKGAPVILGPPNLDQIRADLLADLKHEFANDARIQPEDIEPALEKFFAEIPCNLLQTHALRILGIFPKKQHALSEELFAGGYLSSISLQQLGELRVYTVLADELKKRLQKYNTSMRLGLTGDAFDRCFESIAQQVHDAATPYEEMARGRYLERYAQYSDVYDRGVKEVIRTVQQFAEPATPRRGTKPLLEPNYASVAQDFGSWLEEQKTRLNPQDRRLILDTFTAVFTKTAREARQEADVTIKHLAELLNARKQALQVPSR